MFKKMVLVGILLVVLLVLSGCGTYNADCVESDSQRCYGDIIVQKALAIAGYKCEVDNENIKGLCLAVGDAARCQKLNDLGSSGLKWDSKYVPNYDVNLCVPTCLKDTDCGVLGTCGDKYTCTFKCNTDNDCLPGLTYCKGDEDNKYCSPYDYLSKPELLVELEVKEVKRPEFWVDVYLTSTTNRIYSIGANLALLSSNQDAAGFTTSEVHPLFGDVKVKDSGKYSYLNKDPASPPIPLTPGAKTYFGRLKMTAFFNGGKTDISLDGFDLAKWKENQNYLVKLKSPLSLCVPKDQNLVCDGAKCGFVSDGCSGFVDCSQQNKCVEGQVCVNNACQVVAPQLLPQNAPQKDKTVLQAVADSLKNNQGNPVDALLDIFTALNAWLK